MMTKVHTTCYGARRTNSPFVYMERTALRIEGHNMNDCMPCYKAAYKFYKVDR